MSGWNGKLKQMNRKSLDKLKALTSLPAGRQELVEKQLFIALEEHWLADLGATFHEGQATGAMTDIAVARMENKILDVEFHKWFKIQENVIVLGVPNLYDIEMSEELRKALKIENLLGRKISLEITSGKIDFLGLCPENP